MTFFMELDVQTAKSQFEKALGVNKWPESPTSNCFCSYIHLLESLRNFDQALELLNRVLEIDPSYFNKNFHLAWNHLFNGRIRMAKNLFLKATEDSSSEYGYEGLCQIAIYHEEDYQEGISLMEDGINAIGRHPYYLSLQAIAYYRNKNNKAFLSLKKGA